MESSQPLQSAPGPRLTKILIPLVVLALVIVGYGVLAKNNTWWPHDSSGMGPTFSPQVSSTANSHVRTDGEGNKVYQHDGFGLTFTAPRNFEIFEGDESVPDPIQIVGQNAQGAIDSFEVSISTSYIRTDVQQYEGVAYRKQRTIGKNTWYEFRIPDQYHGQGCDVLALRAEHNGILYTVKSCGGESFALPGTADNRIVSSFSFSAPVSDTTDWQTYRNDQPGYHFEYPTTWKYEGKQYSWSITKPNSEDVHIAPDFPGQDVAPFIYTSYLFKDVDAAADKYKKDTEQGINGGPALGIVISDEKTTFAGRYTRRVTIKYEGEPEEQAVIMFVSSPPGTLMIIGVENLENFKFIQ